MSVLWLWPHGFSDPYADSPCAAFACVRLVSQEWCVVPEPVALGFYEASTQPFVYLDLFALAFAFLTWKQTLRAAVLTYSVRYLCR